MKKEADWKRMYDAKVVSADTAASDATKLLDAEKAAV